ILKELNVEYIVAPYEADAQLAYLYQTRKISAVISEDSDLLVFGVGKVKKRKQAENGRCLFDKEKIHPTNSKVLFKWKRAEGKGDEIVLQNLGSNRSLKFANWTHDMFVDMCILSGCDYLVSIPGIGIKTAHQLISKHGNYQKVVQQLRSEGKIKIPENYPELFQKAKWSFRHQTVYDKELKRLVHLNPLPVDLGNQDIFFLGPMFENETAQKIAEGLMDPITKCLFEDSASKLCSALPHTTEDELVTRRQSLGTVGPKKKRRNRASCEQKIQNNTLEKYCERRKSNISSKSIPNPRASQEKANDGYEKCSPSPPPPVLVLEKEYLKRLEQFKGNIDASETNPKHGRCSAVSLQMQKNENNEEVVITSQKESQLFQPLFHSPKNEYHGKAMALFDLQPVSTGKEIIATNFQAETDNQKLNFSKIKEMEKEKVAQMGTKHTEKQMYNSRPEKPTKRKFSQHEINDNDNDSSSYHADLDMLVHEESRRKRKRSSFESPFVNRDASPLLTNVHTREIPRAALDLDSFRNEIARTDLATNPVQVKDMQQKQQNENHSSSSSNLSNVLKGVLNETSYGNAKKIPTPVDDKVSVGISSCHNTQVSGALSASICDTSFKVQGNTNNNQESNNVIQNNILIPETPDSENGSAIHGGLPYDTNYINNHNLEMWQKHNALRQAYTMKQDEIMSNQMEMNYFTRGDFELTVPDSPNSNTNRNDEKQNNWQVNGTDDGDAELVSLEVVKPARTTGNDYINEALQQDEYRNFLTLKNTMMDTSRIQLHSRAKTKEEQTNVIKLPCSPPPIGNETQEQIRTAEIDNTWTERIGYAHKPQSPMTALLFKKTFTKQRKSSRYTLFLLLKLLEAFLKLGLRGTLKFLQLYFT
ncbi:hypothetical protein RFI_06751, partial [Reticulomyxa filosa]